MNPKSLITTACRYVRIVWWGIQKGIWVVLLPFKLLRLVGYLLYRLALAWEQFAESATDWQSEDPLFIPHLIRWNLNQAVKWIHLLLGFGFLGAGVYFLNTNPLELAYWQYVYHPYKGSPIMAVSCWITAAFFFDHFLRVYRTRRPIRD